MPNEKRPPEGIATGRARKKMDPILREWYGESGSDGELMKYLPGTQPVGNVLQRVMRKKLPNGVADFRTIAARWSEIAGAVAAKHTTPLSITNKTLFIEVEHPAYLASVRTKTVQAAILARIIELIGADKCTALTCVPARRRRTV